MPEAEPFYRVLKKELADVTARRTGGTPAAVGADGAGTVSEDRLAQEEQERAVQREALDRDLTGLALSGGGIRSATFALGVLQGLAQFGLLRRFDYLSTVSGGGYIGSWLAAWIKREGEVESVEKQLRPCRIDQARGRGPALRPQLPMNEEPEPVHHLRAYTAYLAPRRWLFSGDSAVLLAIYLRNIFLNQLVLLPACVFVLLLPRLLAYFYAWGGGPGWDQGLAATMFVFLGVALVSILVKSVITHTSVRREATAHIPLQWGLNLFRVSVLTPLLVFALLASWYLSWDLVKPSGEGAREGGPAAATAGTAGMARGPVTTVREDSRPPRHLPGWAHLVESWLPWDNSRVAEWEGQREHNTSYPISGTLLFGSLFGGLVGLLFLLVRVVVAVVEAIRPSAHARPGSRSFLAGLLEEPRVLLSVFLAGYVGGALLYLVFAALLKGVYWTPYDVAFVTAFGAPLVVAVIVVGVFVAVGLLGTVLSEDEREWWASLCGWLMIYTAVWVAVAGISLFAPWLILIAPAGLQAVMGSGWVLTTSAGVMAGRSPATGTVKSSRVLEWVVRVAPPVVLVGLLALVALLIDAVQGNVPGTGLGVTGAYFKGQLAVWWGWVGLAALSSLVFAALVALCVDVNTFSLQGLYADRLVRCYLGASRPKASGQTDRHSGAPTNSKAPLRQPDPITGFDPQDDLPLWRLRVGPDPQAPEQPYRGPYLLINTALNLAEGDELAWQERKAEAFVLTPHYCGSADTGYRPVDPADPNTPRLGGAVSVSGAAVSPNMGYHSAPAVTALLTVFNARLGAWVRNPLYGEPGSRGPRMGLLYLLRELFGRTNARSRYVYLSDGGHFENLGVYELVRRRCRYIVACDAEQDADYTFDALGALIRKCYTDFGVRIEIDVSPIRPQGEGGRSRWHCAVGRIRYDDAQRGAVEGVLVYLKASLTGDEPTDVLTYAREHPAFPHDPTANQFFTESQFESYRRLGRHVAQEVFRESARGLADGAMTEKAHRLAVHRLFSNLHGRWFPPPPAFDESFLQSVQGLLQVEDALRTDPNLAEFSRSLYPEAAAHRADGNGKPAGGNGVPARLAELHLAGRMGQVMEDVWLGLHLEGYFAHPMNRGWMNTLRRWASCRKFRALWPVLRGQFSKDFVRFCESELRLSGGSVQVESLLEGSVLLSDQPPSSPDPGKERLLSGLRELGAEFSREWPGETRLADRVQKAWDWANNKGPCVWLITVRPEGQPDGDTDTEVCGIVVAGPGAEKGNRVDLLVYVRGPYRDLRLGRAGMRLVLEQMRQSDLYRQAALVTRYPTGRDGKRDDRLGDAVWWTFFTFYGFRTPEQATDEEKQYVVLTAQPTQWQDLA